jgi:hypothetical protein
MTTELLQHAGVCGSYRQTFERLFPSTEYPDGVDVTPEVCEGVAEQFDWGSARGYFLNDTGQRRHRVALNRDNAVMTSVREAATKITEDREAAIAAWQARYDQPNPWADWDTRDDARTAFQELERTFDQRTTANNARISQHAARTFAELVVQPQYQRSDLDTLIRTAEQTRTRNARKVLTDAEHAVADARTRIEVAERDLAHWTEQLPNLERALIQVRATFTAAEVGRAQARAQSAADAVAEAEKIAAEAAAELAKLDVESTDAKTTDAAQAKV